MPTIKIAYLYEDLMNTYGDAGDVKILRHFLKQKNYACSVQNVSLGDDFNAFDYDLVFCGGGQDFEQTVVAKDFLRHRQTLTDYIEDDRLYLGICGGYQFLGSYYQTSKNDRIECLNILPFHTIFNPQKRMIGDTRCTTAYGEVKAFENHSGQTFFDDNNLQPFGKMIEGYGNNPEDGVDGVAYKSVICSYSHGPLLKNTNVAMVLADKMIANYLKYRV
ncbi:type 1 glutamine amidotransferase [Bombilactobacillus thymidiniphilus]|uniref:Lipid II isoglutaminyl synthase (glutamine-hydrolyzing) subunit GatD n=1 Tax=Bombilactobacillus thymidiniphilus TaxID=2923363 RepID=A0ABY4PBV4_9LACO|nr:cobalamin biosynthesis protein CobQ [Bombilactobacillus thymidiniphilus]UQS83017.1 cobalamin biosynthesis protein CobQ [Bombilactobacillus thymidiniphilus]